MKKQLLLLTALFCGTASTIFSQDLYQIGDIVDFNGTKGYVYKVSSNGRHGMAVSISDFQVKKWCTDKAIVKKVIEGTTIDDGVKNMEAYEQTAKAAGKDMAIYPAFEWAQSLGQGWYIPSIKELKELLEILVTAPAGEEDNSEGDDEESVDQEAIQAQEQGSVLNLQEYRFKVSKKSKKYVDKVGKAMKEAGGNDYVDNGSVHTLMSSSSFGSLPYKYAVKASKDIKNGETNVKEKYRQYEVPMTYLYTNTKPAAAISMWAKFAFGGRMDCTIIGNNQAALLKPRVRAIIAF